MLDTRKLSAAKTVSQISLWSSKDPRCLGNPYFIHLVSIQFLLSFENCGTVLAVLCCTHGSSVQRRRSCSYSLWSSQVPEAVVDVVSVVSVVGVVIVVLSIVVVLLLLVFYPLILITWVELC